MSEYFVWDTWRDAPLFKTADFRTALYALIGILRREPRRRGNLGIVRGNETLRSATRLAHMRAEELGPITD